MVKMISKLLLCILLTTLISVISGWGTFDVSNIIQNTEVSTSNVDSETLLSIIKGENIELITLDKNDIISSISEVNNYNCNNAIYVSVKNNSNNKYYTYRFQLDKKGSIISYVRYELEG